MAEMLNVRVRDTGEERTIADVEPTESAKLFWQVSNAIWEQRSKTDTFTRFDVASALPMLEARDTLNEVLGGIDEGLVIAGIGKAVKLNGFRADDQIELAPELLDTPARVHIGTYNWDEQNTWRHVDIAGKSECVMFTDGHKDKYRELNASFGYWDKNRQAVELTYAMQRIQLTQDQPISLSMNIWHSQFAETGYEGSNLKHVPLSVEQELRVLRAFQAIGGITPEAPSQE